MGKFRVRLFAGILLFAIAGMLFSNITPVFAATPIVANPISDQSTTVGATFNFQFSSNTFSDPDEGHTLTYTAQLEGGSELPEWLNFNAATRTFSGTPTEDDIGTLSVEVIADDGEEGTVSDLFEIAVNGTPKNLTSASNKDAEIHAPVAITDLQITGGGGSEELVITVHAASGRFTFDNEAASINGYDTNVVTLSGTKSAINTTLASMYFTPEEEGDMTITADLGNNVGNVIFNDGEGGNGHAYIIVNQDVTWQEAREAAEGYTFGGQTGYLATITDQTENDFVWDNLQDTGWIGATDQESVTGEEEGEWYWVTGPEAGTQFWSGGPTPDGQSVDGNYANWEPGTEPNDYNWDEDCGQFWNDGYWNDYPCDYTRPFVVEFGGDGELTPIQQTFTVTTTTPSYDVADCDELEDLNSKNRYGTIYLTADIDCEGRTVTPLFEEGFNGRFYGDDFTISNVTLDDDEAYTYGLFARINNATVRDVTLDGFEVNAYQTAGTLAGEIIRSDITNVHITNTSVTTGNGWTGGLAGVVVSSESGSQLFNVSVSGKITSSGADNVGGIGGFVEGNAGTLSAEQTFSDVDITVSGEGNDVGGLFGEVEIDSASGTADAAAMIRNSYAWGSIHAKTNDNIGGLVGRIDFVHSEDFEATALIRNSYARGNIHGNTGVGGLVGRLEAPNEDATLAIENSFAMASVIASEDAANRGGFIGRVDEGSEDYMMLNNNFWDKTRSGQEFCNQNTTLNNCTAVNVAGDAPRYFLNNATNNPLNEWNFDDVWVANSLVPPTFLTYNGSDLDGDGVNDSVENSGPNNGDANSDGIPDFEQAHVTSFINPITDKYVALEVSQQCVVASVGMEAETNDSDREYSYANGLMNFRLECDEVGFAASIKHYYFDVEAPVGSEAVRKYLPETSTYFTISSAQISTTDAGQPATTASYTVTDGEELDLDNEANAIIIDPAGIGSLADTSDPSTRGGLANTGINTWALLSIATLLIITATGLIADYYRKQHSY